MFGIVSCRLMKFKAQVQAVSSTSIMLFAVFKNYLFHSETECLSTLGFFFFFFFWFFVFASFNVCESLSYESSVWISWMWKATLQRKNKHWIVFGYGGKKEDLVFPYEANKIVTILEKERKLKKKIQNF